MILVKIYLEQKKLCSNAYKKTVTVTKKDS